MTDEVQTSPETETLDATIALRNLLQRIDDHFGHSDHRWDWKEQADARAALSRGHAQCLDLKPVAWRYRFVTSIYGDLSDWFIVDDEKSIPSRNPNMQTVQPLYTTGPDTSTDRTSK